MTTTRIVPGTVDNHVFANKPTKSFRPTMLRVDKDEANTLIRFSIPNDLPDDAVITGARLRFRQQGDWSGTATLSAQRVERWNANRVTWNTQPDVVAGSIAATDTQTDTPHLQPWVLDVTADVIAWRTGGERNYGWRITSSSTLRRKLHGLTSPRAKLRPTLELDYIVAPEKATDLRPSFGAVSVTKPRLTWTGAGFTEFRVQVDPTGEFTAPTFDSGWLPSLEPFYDLASSAYGGITSGSTSWRVNLRNANGESDWSAAVSFPYAALVDPVITNPGATVTDGTPPITWTGAGQVQRRVVLRDSAGIVVDNSGWETTTEQAYTPAKGLRDTGPASVEVNMRDNVLREATPGAPDYGTNIQEFTYTRTATVAPVTWLSVTRHPVYPVPVLRWDRDELADEWVVLRDGQVIEWWAVDGIQQAILDTGEAAVSGVFEWVDWYAAPNKSHVYDVRPKVNGEEAATGRPQHFTPACDGHWLIDPDTDRAICLADATHSLAYGEQTTIHTPIGDVASVKVNHGMRGLEGTISGVFDTFDGRTWVEQDADLMSMKADASSVYRLIFGDLNIPVVTYEVTTLVREDTLPHAWRQSASFGVLQQGELPWED